MIEEWPWSLSVELLGLPLRVAAIFATPTATANQLAPSMQRWPGCRRLQTLVGKSGSPSVELYEWLMGFPEGWTD